MLLAEGRSYRNKKETFVRTFLYNNKKKTTKFTSRNVAEGRSYRNKKETFVRTFLYNNKKKTNLPPEMLPKAVPTEIRKKRSLERFYIIIKKNQIYHSFYSALVRYFL